MKNDNNEENNIKYRNNKFHLFLLHEAASV